MTQSELYTYARRLVNATATDWAESDLLVDLNDALSDVWVRIKAARGTLAMDDSNASTLPSYTFNLTSGTQQYKVTTDGTDELLSVYKVQVLDGTTWVDVPRLTLDENNQDGLSTTETARIPTGYYDMYPYIVFKEIPSTSVTNGLRVWADREITYFALSGTTAKPGIPLIYHPLIAEKAAFKYATINNIPQSGNIYNLVQLGEARIEEYERQRKSDERKHMTPANHSSR
jgi:hypothetical protein